MTGGQGTRGPKGPRPEEPRMSGPNDQRTREQGTKAPEPFLDTNEMFFDIYVSQKCVR